MSNRKAHRRVPNWKRSERKKDRLHLIFIEPLYKRLFHRNRRHITRIICNQLTKESES